LIKKTSNNIDKMKKIVMVTLVLIVSFLIAQHSEAQFGGGGGTPGGGGTGGGIPGTGGGPEVPFDGGMSLMLIASGIGYGAKYLKKQKF